MPSRLSGIGDCPPAMESTTRGHRNEIARPVNMFAPPSDIPVESATLAATSAAFWPGSDSIGQTDWPTATRLAGSVVPPRPALLTAFRNASVVGSACAGAANSDAVAARPADTAIRPIGLVRL